MTKRKLRTASRSPARLKRSAAESAPSVVPPASAPFADAQPPLTVWVFFAFSWLIGWWLAFDGLRQRITGDYTRINGQLGPWALLVRAAGLDPLSLGWFFVVLGLAFVAASFGLYLRQRWGYIVGLAASALGLLYLGFGTPVALVCLVALLLAPTRAYVASRYTA